MKAQFDTHLPNLLREMIEGHPSPGPLVVAVNLTMPILRALAARAIELDDPQLNVIMLRLALYEIDADKRPAAIEEQRKRADRPTCYSTGLPCLSGCNGRTCAGAHIPLNKWPET